MQSIRLSLLILVGAALFSPLSAKDINSSLEESLALRRISEYWKEKDYKTVKTQAIDFLNRNPNSSYADKLNAMLGDLYFQEKDYEEAILAYEKIEDRPLWTKIQFRYLHSLYEMGKHEKLVESADLFLKNPNSESDEIDTIHFELAESFFALAHACGEEEKKEKLLREAIAGYQQVMQTKYCDLTLKPQAGAYALLEENSKAASLYLLLAQKEIEKREEWLFRAAALQVDFDEKLATQTFGEIVEMGSANAPKAAYNQLNLLFQQKRYKDFILAYDKASKYIPKESQALIRYFLGQSLFYMKNFEKAITPLSEALASKALDHLQEKNALLALTTYANEKQDLALFDKALVHLKLEFLEEEETLNAILLHAQLCREKKEWMQARLDIKEALEIHPNHPEREALVFDVALLLSQENRWVEGAEAFETFLEEFPRSEQRAAALRHLVVARQEDLKLASAESQKVKQQLLLEALEMALEESKTFASSEKQKLRWLMGRIQYDLCQYEEAIETLSQYLVDFGTEPSCAEACVLLAYSHLKGSQDQIQFVLNAERALAYNAKLEGSADLRLRLFNTYLELAAKAPIDEKKDIIAKAADHLFFALEKPVHKDNQRWLAGYYFQQYQNGEEGAVQKAAHVLERLLGIEGDSIALSIDAQSLDMESEAIKLAATYEKMGCSEKRVNLLQTLLKEQNAHQELHWKYQRMTQFELGKTYLVLGDKEKALSTFTDLIDSSAYSSSYFALAAQAERAKLEFSMLETSENKESALARICDALKDVQIRRKLHSEPLHLEAALEYVTIKTTLADQDIKKECEQFYLHQMRNNFSAPDDPLVEEYLSAASQFPDKQALYEQYLSYVDTEIMAVAARKSDDFEQKREAKKRFKQLLAESRDATLTARIQKSMEALAKDL